MPRISDRSDFEKIPEHYRKMSAMIQEVNQPQSNLSTYKQLAGEEATGRYNPAGSIPPQTIQETAYGGMSIAKGNRVPMRGTLPIEQMTDSDLYSFYPYNSYTDRTWKYTYFTLFNAT